MSLYAALMQKSNKKTADERFPAFTPHKLRIEAS
jgi:hypothetical protein